MTDSATVPTKTDPPEGDPPSDTITIDVKGLEGLSKEQIEQINTQFSALQTQSTDTIAALTKQIDTLSKKVDKAENKTEEAQKAVLLDKLKEAKYDPEGFKTLDLKSLQTVVEGIAKTNSGIVLKNLEGKDDPTHNKFQATVLDLKTGKRKPFYE